MTSPELAPPDYESLLQFLYVAPVGLMQTTLDGRIALINPLAANLLLPLQRTTRLTNLFEALEMVAPELRNMVERFAPARCEICRGWRIQVSAGGAGGNEPHVLEISLIKLGNARLMAVLSDVSAIVKREQIVRQGAAWLSAIVSGAIDYAAIQLSAQGIISSWDPALEKLTGHADVQVLGRSFAMLFADTAQVRERAGDYLWEARESGWSLREGQCLRNDGSFFDACSLIAAAGRFDAAGLPASVAVREPNQFVLIIRDITNRVDSRQ